jgi:hypothetical protein
MRISNLQLMRIDHLVYAAPALGAAIDDLEELLGVRAEHGGKHLGLGTHNALLALGDTSYLEIIAADPDQPAPARRPFGIDDLRQPRLVGWAVSTGDIDAAIAQARAAGFDPGDSFPMERTTDNGVVLRWRLTLNALDGGPVPFLIDWGETEHPARSAPAGVMLERLEIEHSDPVALSKTLQALGIDVAVKSAESTALVAQVRGPTGVKELR